MKKFFSCLILLISNYVSYAQDLYPAYWDSHSVLTDITFVNDTMGFVVGSNGKILKTIDEGLNWDSITPPIIADFNSIYFKSTYEGYISGSNGVLLKTQDAGNTWTIIESNTNQSLNQIIFFNSLVGIAVGDVGTIVKTSDGGMSWLTQNSGTTLKFRCVSFSTIDTIFIGSENGLFKTYDGGISWIKDMVDFSAYNSNGCNVGTNNIKQINFTAKDTAFLLTDGCSPIALRTSNKAANWVLIHNGSPTFLRSICFKSNNLGFLVSNLSGSYIRKTVNSGTNWTKLDANNYWPNWTGNYRTYDPIKLIHKGNYFYCITAYIDRGGVSPLYYNFQISKSTELVRDKNILFSTFNKSTYGTGPGAVFPFNKFFNQAKFYKINKQDSTVSALDSCITDSEGLFSFDTKEDSVYFKIIPNPLIFQNYIPTYGDSVFTIQQAKPVKFNANRFQYRMYRLLPYDLNSRGGSLQLSGNIFTASALDQNIPLRIASNGVVKNLTLILVNSMGKPVLLTNTNSEGYFNFENLKPDTYKIYVDYPFINNGQAPTYNLTSSQTDLQFVLHKTYLAEEAPLAVKMGNSVFSNVKLYPNPSADQVVIEYEMIRSGKVKIELYDVTGYKIKEILSEEQFAGNHKINFTLDFKGVFMLKLDIDGVINTTKLVHN